MEIQRRGSSIIVCNDNIKKQLNVFINFYFFTEIAKITCLPAPSLPSLPIPFGSGGRLLPKIKS
jgi:hypothetical protein